MNFKKIILVIIVVVAFLMFSISIFNIYNKKMQENRIKQFKEAAVKYYDDYMSNLANIDEIYITLNILRNSNRDYDIKLLEKCSSESSLILEISYDSIKFKKINLNCD